jgi:hypothetical protein
MLKAEGDMVELTVGKGGDYSSIQEALDAIPYRIPARVVVKKGEYHEKLFVTNMTCRWSGRMRRGKLTMAWKRSLMDTNGGRYAHPSVLFRERLRLVNLTSATRRGKEARWEAVDCIWTSACLIGKDGTGRVAGYVVPCSPSPEGEGTAGFFASVFATR